MKSALVISTSITALLGLSACNRFDIDSGRSQILGGEQRALLVKNGANGPYGSGDGGKTYLGSEAHPLVCAEPSPDAISTAALTAAISADVAGQGRGAAGVSYGESAASIAARTAAVQVLRDIEYRACEALMNGVVGPQHYNQILAASVYTTIGLVAVDGLGQAQMAKQLSISMQPGTLNISLPETQPAQKAAKAEDSKSADAAKKTDDTAGAAKEKSSTGSTTIALSSGSASPDASTQGKAADGARRRLRYPEKWRGRSA